MSLTNDEGFYLNCPSNASMDMFSDNTLSKFSVNLPKPLELKGEYEVGLAEIHHPQTWNNIRKGSNTIDIRYVYGANAREKRMTRSVPPGYYASIPALITVIKKICEQTDQKRKTGLVKLVGLKMAYNASTRRVTINTENMKMKIPRATGRTGSPKTRLVQIQLAGDVARLLGFSPNTLVTTKTGSKESEFAAVPSGGFHQLYVYSDCIHPQPHPDQYVSMLRAIAIDGESNRGQYVSKRFRPIYYYPLKTPTLTTISFDLYDDTGTHIGFDEGKVLLVLHIRRRMQAV